MPADGSALSATLFALERAVGHARLEVGLRDGNPAVLGLAQSGCGRLLFPARRSADPLEAVIVNTAGGLTGGDRYTVDVAVAPGARAVATTQACERLYRSSAAAAVVETRLAVADAASLAWLPQETILFDRSRLTRTLEVSLAETASFTLVEGVVLGRKASGETLTDIAFRDSWRIRRGGRLIFAEEMRFGEALADELATLPSLGGQGAFATVLHAAPDIFRLVDEARALCDGSACDIGIGALDGLVLARLVAADSAKLRAALIPLVRLFAGRVPLVWSL